MAIDIPSRMLTKGLEKVMKHFCQISICILYFALEKFNNTELATLVPKLWNGADGRFFAWIFQGITYKSNNIVEMSNFPYEKFNRAQIPSLSWTDYLPWVIHSDKYPFKLFLVFDVSFNNEFASWQKKSFPKKNWHSSLDMHQHNSQIPQYATR